MGEIRYRQHTRGSTTLVIKGSTVLEDLKVGDSIAVNGVCLTATEVTPPFFYADVMPETLRKTNLYQLRPGDKVNLERALTAGGRLGGHIVTGHVDGTGIILAEKKEGIALIKKISAPPEVGDFLIEKGSVAVDGISLTVVEVTGNAFTVSLVSHTVRNTTLGFKKKGDTVNLEADILGKYIYKLFYRTFLEGKLTAENYKNISIVNNNKEEGLSLKFLRDKGII